MWYILHAALTGFFVAFFRHTLFKPKKERPLFELEDFMPKFGPE